MLQRWKLPRALGARPHDFGSGPSVFRAWAPEGTAIFRAQDIIYINRTPSISLVPHGIVSLGPGAPSADLVKFDPDVDIPIIW